MLGIQSRSARTSARTDSRNISSGSGGIASRIGRFGEAPRIGVGPEQRRAAVGPAIGLQPLEDLLGVVEHRRGRIHRERLARGDARVVPALPARHIR